MWSRGRQCWRAAARPRGGTRWRIIVNRDAARAARHVSVVSSGGLYDTGIVALAALLDSRAVALASVPAALLPGSSLHLLHCALGPGHLLSWAVMLDVRRARLLALGATVV